MKKSVILLLIILVACEEIENCADDPSAFTRDICWTIQAKETKDVNLCLNIETFSEVCVGNVAAALNQPELCEKHAKREIATCMRIFKKELLQTKIDKCTTMKELDAQVCINALAIENNEANICAYSVDKINCALNFADEKGSPEAILANTVAGQERDLALATYASITLDTSAWNLIQDNRVHDSSVIYAPAIAYVKNGKVPITTYCESQLKGDYVYYGTETVEEEFLRNKNICHTVVAAVESAAKDEDLCGLRLSLNIQSNLPEDLEEKQDDAVKNCQKLFDKLQAAEKLENTQDFEKRLALLNKLQE